MVAAFGELHLAADGHNTQEGMLQQPPDKEEQITTTRGQSSADRDIQRAYIQGKSQQPRGRSRQSQQPDGKQKQIATTRKQSKADRGNQKTKVRGRSKQTKRKQSNTDRGNQKTKVRGRSKQPRVRSGKIATTRNPSWQFETTQIKSNRGQKSPA